MDFERFSRRLTATALRRLGDTVQIGLQEGLGQLAAPTLRVIDGAAIATGWELTYSVEDFAAVPRGTVVIVNGTNYVAREDGLIQGDQTTGTVPLERQDAQGEVEYIIDGNA
jgi:hypothetical protein